MSDFTCMATPVQQQGAIFYVAVVKATELDTICRPLTRPAPIGLFGRETAEPLPLTESEFSALVRSMESKKFQLKSTEVLAEKREQPYQRFMDEKRAVEISRYLAQPSSLLPNSIILAVNVDLDESDVLVGEGRHLKIVLPHSENSSVILDGQHRVGAFRHLEPSIRDSYEVIVAFLVGIPFYQQAELFAIINGKQKPVNRSIIYDLFGYAPIGGDREEKLYEGLMAIFRFSSHVARILNYVGESPWKGKIKMRGPGDIGIISQAAVVEYLSTLVEPKKFTARLRVLPLLYSFFKNSDPAGCAAVLILYIRAIQAALPVEWENRQSLLWKNNGIALVLRILHDDLFLAGSSKQLMNDYGKIIARWRKAPRAEINSPPKTGGGGIQIQLYDKFKAAMFSTSETTKLNEARDTLKKELLSMGALVK